MILPLRRRIHNFLQKAVEKATGKTCDRCKHCYGFICDHPDPRTGDKCRTGIFPVGYEKGGHDGKTEA